MAIKIDSSKCVGCGTCISVCPASIYEVIKGRARVKKGFEKDCLQCHACEVNCPQKAITIT